MATIDETLGQSISEDIEREEDQISKQGGVGISLDDFTTSGVIETTDKEDGAKYENKKGAEDDNSEYQKAINSLENLNQDYDFSQSIIPDTVISDLALNTISDIDLMITMDRDLDIVQVESLANEQLLQGGIEQYTDDEPTINLIINNLDVQLTNIIDQINPEDIIQTSSTAVESAVMSGDIQFALTDLDGSANTSIKTDNGSAIINDNGEVVFTPIDGFTGETTVVVTVTDEDGNTQEQTFNVVVEDNLEDSTVTSEPVVEVTLTDLESNLVSATDTTPPEAPTVTFESTGEDDIYNSNELGEDGTVTATIRLSTDATVGYVLNINGEEQILTQDDIDAGQVEKQVSPDETITVTLTDLAGNTSVDAIATAASSDTTVGTPTISFESTGDDDLYNQNELGEDGTVTATIGLPGDTQAGDTLTINDIPQELTQDDIDAGSVQLQVEPEANITVTLTDIAGNVSEAVSGTAAPADTETTISSDLTTDTGIDSDDNITNDNTPTISGEGEPGSTVVITDVNGNEIGIGVVAEDGTYSITTSELPDGTQDLTITSTDLAGNTATTTQNITVDTTADEGTVTVDAITEDDVINATEAGETITVTGSATGGDISTGDTVTATINGTEYSTTVGADGSYSFDVAGSDLAADTEFTVNVASTDAAGNEVTSSADSTHTVDTEATEGTVTVNSITEDDVINATEAGETITVTGSATGGDISTGDTVTATINGTEYSTTVGADGSYSFDVAGSDLAADTEFTVNVASTDAAGNEVTSSADSTHTVDTTATVTVDTDIIEGSEVTTELTNSGDSNLNNPGDSATFTLDSPASSVNVDIDSYKTGHDEADVTVTYSDGTTETFNLDTFIDGTLNNQPTTVNIAVDGKEISGVSITHTGDNSDAFKVDGASAVDTGGTTLEITGTTTDIEAGQEVSITITDSEGNETTTTAEVQADGTYSVDVDASGFAQGDITTSVSVTDTAGNIATDSEVDSIETVGINDGPDAINDGGIVEETVTIDSNNVNSADSGFTVSAFDASGNSAEISTNQYGFGITGAASGADAELGYNSNTGTSESIVVDLDGEASSVDVSFGWQNSREDAEVTFFKDGVEVGSVIDHGGSDRVDAAVTLAPENGASFDQVVFTAPEGGGSGGHDYMINSISFTQVKAEIETAEDTSTTIDASTLLANDTDADGDTLTISSVQDATNGTVSLDADGNVVFTPEANYNGEASFTYTISDGNGGTDTATVTLNVDSVNDAPVVTVDSTATVDEDGSVNINYTATDLEGDVTVTATAENGTVVVNEDGTLTFTPNENYNGTDTITVTATDADGATHTQEVAVTVDAVNDGPDAINDTSTTEQVFEDTSNHYSVGDNNSVSYDIGEEANEATVTVTGLGGEIWTETLVINAYDSDGNLVESFSFDGNNNESTDFTINTDIPFTSLEVTGDGIEHNNGNTGDASFAIQNVTASMTTDIETAEDTSTTIDASTLLANDTDVDGDTLSITSVQDATNGTVSLDADGNVVFTPEADYNGPATFTYTVSDGNGGTDTATVTLNVDSVNDAVSVVTDIDATANIVDENVADGTYAGVTLSATDADGEAVTYSVADGVPFTVNENGEIVTSGAIDFETTPSYTFDVTATSADGTTSTQSITIDVADVVENVAPVAVDDSYTSNTGSTGYATIDEDNFTPNYTNGSGWTGDDQIHITETPSANIYAREGDDEILIDADVHGVQAGAGNDVIVDNSDTGNTLAGEDGDDTIYGGAGDDTLWGDRSWGNGSGAGDDVLVGGAGDDIIRLDGGGTDTVVLTNDNFGSQDQVVGFGSDDKLDISEVISSLNLSGTNSEIALQLANSVNAVEIDWKGPGLAITVDGQTQTVQFTDGDVKDNLDSILSGSTTMESVLENMLDNGTLIITPAGDNPLTTDEDTSLTIDSSSLLSNDTDADGDTLTISSVQDATNGTVSLDADGNVVFTPDADYNGPATFTYTVSDGNGGEDTATVTLNVDSVNDAVSVVTDIDATANIVDENVSDGTYTGVTLNATDADGDAITYSLPDNVPFSIDENGQIVTDGEIDFETTPSYTFDVTATSADGTTSTQSVTINVKDIVENVDPEATAETAEVTEDSIITGQIDATDADGDDLTFSISEGGEASWSDNLVANGDASSGANGWTVESGDLRTGDWNNNSANDENGAHFYGRGDTVVSQEIDISSLEGDEFHLSADQGGWGDGDTSELSVTFLDANGNQVGDTVSLGAQTGTANAEFVNHETTGSIPEGAVTATVSVHIDRVSGGDADGYIDNISFEVGNSGSVEIPEGLTVNADGSYEFDASSYDSLDAGENSVLNIPITVTDENGGTTETTLTVDISGTSNDLTYVSESAGYNNVVGYYELDGDGNPTGAAVVIDNQNGMDSGEHLADLSETGDYGFFIIANGANEVDENSVITFDTTGDTPVLLINGSEASHPVYHDTPEWNPDGMDHFVFTEDPNGGMTIGIEDLPNLGDNDFNDVVLHSDVVLADKVVAVVDENADQDLHFRNVEHHSDTENSTDYDDYIETELTTGDGNDTIIVEDDVGSTNDASNGGDRTISTGAGDDTVSVGGDVQHGATIDTGDGNDTVTLGDTGYLDLDSGASVQDGGTIDTGAGDDTVSIEDKVDDSTISTGTGDDSVTIGSLQGDSDLSTGDGADTVTIDRVAEDATIDTGAGDDTVTLDDVSSGFDAGSVDLGDGTDTLVINDSLSGTEASFNGGDGIDHVTLTNVSVEDWDGGIKDQFTNFESVTLSDGTTLDLTDTETTVDSDLASSSDTGVSNSDNITSDNTPTIIGNGEAGATVVITDADGNEVGSTVVGEDGTYSITTSELSDGEQTLTITATDTAGNIDTDTQTITVDTTASDMGDLAITNIVDNEGDYSSVTISGTGAEAGNTITLFDENNNEVGTAQVQEDGTWSADISNLSGTPVNDNEFFKATETDTAGNETGQTDSTHFWHGNWNGIGTESTDDFVMAGSGDDTIHTDDTISGVNENGYVTSANDDVDDKVVLDGGDGDDTVTFGKEISEYTITTDANGNTIVTESAASDSDGDGAGDVTELRNVETVEFADGTLDTATGTFSSFDTTADDLTASIQVGSGDVISTTTTVIDTEANETNGIHEVDGVYYKTETQDIDTGVVDTDALRELGYTMDSDGNFYVIDEDAPKQLIEQEVEVEVTKIIDADPIMKVATETTTYESLGEAHVDDGAVIAKKSGIDFDFEEPTSNIELDFANFDTGTAKISFYDADGNQVGSTVNTSHTNGAEGYTVPDGAVGVTVYNNTNSNNFEVESISYRGEPGEVTVEAGGLVPDYEAMEAAGISWSETEDATVVQTADITNIGNVGNGQVDGFNPEDTESSQVFDFGPELANRLVTITVDMEVVGSWDNSSSTTNDYFSVSANGKEIDVNHYSNKSSGHDSDDVEVINSGGSDFTYEYEVYLDDNGQVQLDFMVASTASNEVVNVENIEVAYTGQTGWVQEVTETEIQTQSVLVDAPAEQVNADDIPGGVPTVVETREVEVEVEPITTTVTEVEGISYPVDISASLSDTDGSETLSVTITGIPADAVLMDGDVQITVVDGVATIDVPNGDTSITDSLTITVPEGTGEFTLGISATATEISTGDTNTVTDTDIAFIPNEAPEATNDTSTTDEDSSVNIDATSNDTDSDQLFISEIAGQDVTGGQTVTITDDIGNTLGTASLTADGEIEFTPSNYLQSMDDGVTNVELEYTVSDGTETDTATVSIEVTSTGDADAPTLDMDIGDAEFTAAQVEDSEPVVTTFSDTDTESVNGTWNSASYDLGGVTNSVDVSFKNLKGQNDEEAKVELIDGDGNVVDTVIIQGNNGNGNETHTISSNSEFSSIKVSGVDWADDFKVTGVSAEVESTDGNVINSANNYWTNNETINGTEGSDTINIGEGDNKTVNAGGGDDTINTPTGYWSGDGHDIDGGAGNDTLVIDADQDNGSTRYDIVDNGDGTHTITAISYNNWSEWDAGYEVTVDNVENIQFNDGIVSLGGAEGAQSEGTFSYDIDLNAGLTDTDGSETLSDITLANIPDGATLVGDGVVDNGDGSYTVTPDVNGDATVTLTSPTEIATEDLSGITASVTSTETNGGDTSTTVVDDDGVIEGDIEAFGDMSEDDEFTFDMDELDLDFDNISLDDALGDINTIDMSGDGANDISNIDISDVMNMTDDSNTLTILGDEDDTVSLDTDTWTQGEDVEVDGNTFTSYTSSADDLQTAQLLIDTAVQVDQS